MFIVEIISNRLVVNQHGNTRINNSIRLSAETLVDAIRIADEQTQNMQLPMNRTHGSVAVNIHMADEWELEEFQEQQPPMNGVAVNNV